MSIMIIAIRNVTISAVNRSNESKINVHKKIAAKVKINCMVASCHIVKYCS